MLAEYWRKAVMAEDQWKRTGERFTLWQGSDLLIAGIPFDLPVVGESVRPVAVTPAIPEVEIPVGRAGVRVHVLGQVTLPAGFPVGGGAGETVASYTLRYASGKSREVPSRNGYEVAQANLIAAATRIDPQATEAQRARRLPKTPSGAPPGVALLAPSRGGELKSLHCQLRNQQSASAIFAITVELA